MGNYLISRMIAVVAMIGMVMAGYLLSARPYQLRWGATDEEVGRVMPGDELHVNPTFLSTRAITVEGTADEIWPWLLQMGYGRAGFYAYDVVENLGSERGIRSADRILTEFQHFAVGDEVPISAVVSMAFYAIEPNQYLIWVGDAAQSPGVFTWALYPLDANRTRLVSRIRWSYQWTKPGILALDLFTEFADHIAVRKVLQGVKDRVESRPEPMVKQNIELAIFVAALLVFLVALVVNLLRPLRWRRWLLGLAAGIAWLITWYAPVPLWIGALLVLLVLCGLSERCTRLIFGTPQS